MEPNAEVSRGPCPGEEWAYRLRDDAPSERVRIVRVEAGEAMLQPGRPAGLQGPGVRPGHGW